MPHELIRRAAIALTLMLVFAAAAFAIATTQREARLAARAAVAPVGTAYDAKTASAAFDARCSKCHELDEMNEWLDANPSADRAAKLLDFLKTHKKAPDPESESIARYLSELSAAKP